MRQARGQGRADRSRDSSQTFAAGEPGSEEREEKSVPVGLQSEFEVQRLEPPSRLEQRDPAAGIKPTGNLRTEQLRLGELQLLGSAGFGNRQQSQSPLRCADLILGVRRSQSTCRT